MAVALAESGGLPCAVGDVGLMTGTWGPSVGLWQIRSLWSAKGSGGVRDELVNADPAVAARHAHGIWRAHGWRPWSTWLHGTHRRFL